MTTQIQPELATKSYDSIKKILKTDLKDLDLNKTYTILAQCLTVRFANKTKLLFLELCDGSTVLTLQCVCDSSPKDENDTRREIDWVTLFDFVNRGCTVEITGKIIESPGEGQSIELVCYDFQCIGKIENPDKYPLGQRSYISRSFLRQIPHQRHHTQLFLAIGIIKQTCYRAFHDVMKKLEIGEVQPTLITSNECEEGAHPFTVTTILDNENGLPLTDDRTIDYTKDFFKKRVFLTVSSQLHLEATVLGTKRDGYCMTTAFRAEPSKTKDHLAEFLMPEWEIIGGGIERNMAIAQRTLQHIFSKILEECYDELEYLERYQGLESLNKNEKYREELGSLQDTFKDGKISCRVYLKLMKDLSDKYVSEIECNSLIERLERWSSNNFIICPHKECVRRIQEAISEGELDETYHLNYEDDLSRIHEYWICDVIGEGLPVAVTRFPKEIKAFYMPIVEEEEYILDKDGNPIYHIDGYDLLIPDVGEVIGGSQRIDDLDKLVHRMTELDMNLNELDWYIKLREDASLPHGGAGLGFGRLMVAVTGIHNIKDMQEFPRSYKKNIVA